MNYSTASTASTAWRCMVAVLATSAVVACGSGALPGIGPLLGRPDPILLPAAVYTTADTVARFAPGTISQGSESGATLLPDGRTLFFASTGREMPSLLRGNAPSGSSDTSGTVIMRSAWSGVEWTTPQPVSWNVGSRQMDPHVGLNGRAIYFSAPRRRDATREANDGDWDLWSIRLNDNEDAPQRLPSLINSSDDETHPSITIDSTIYFAVSFLTRDGVRQSEIRYHHKKLRTTPAAVVLGPTVSNPSHPFITPDGRVLLFAAGGRETRGALDLYLSIRREDGRFLAPQHLGREVNGDEAETDPALTADGTHLFFTRRHAGGGSDIYVVPVASLPVLRDALRALRRP